MTPKCANGSHHARNSAVAMTLRSLEAVVEKERNGPPCEPAHRQEPLRRQLRHDLRDQHERFVLQHEPDRAPHGALRARSRAPREGARRVPWRSRWYRFQGSSAAALRGGFQVGRGRPRPSTACRDTGAYRRGCRPSSAIALWTWPSEAAAAGVRSNARKRFSQSGPSSASIRRRTKAGPIGGAAAWSFCSSTRIFGRQQVGDCREHLRELHQRALQPAERGPDIGSVAHIAELASEQARSSHPRRDPADIGPDPRIADDPAGKSVLFWIGTVGHRPVSRDEFRGA